MKKSKLEKDLKIGKLTATSKNEEESKRQNRVCWNAICECGNERIITSKTISDSHVYEVSCGCVIDSTPLNEMKVDDVYGKLTLKSYYKNKWTCDCSCGGEITAKTNAIKLGGVKSCGCLLAEIIDLNRKYNPERGSAIRVWREHYVNWDKKHKFDINQTLSFEDFYELSQQNCFYCGISPSKTHNKFKKEQKDGKNPLPRSIAEGDFIYNGLDRKNNSVGHSKDNCITACWMCNRAKRKMPMNEFLNWIKNLQIIDKAYEIKTKELSKYYISSVKKAFKRYNDGDLTLEEFECLTQYNCHYCNRSPSNYANYILDDKRKDLTHVNEAEFKYNGLDRIDSSLPHNKNNILPACYPCNWAKSNYTIEQFHEWIRRIKKFQGYEIK